MIKLISVIVIWAMSALTAANAQTSATVSAELAATMAALTPSSLNTAIDAFDAAPRMGHPRLFKGQADYAGIIAATTAERKIAIVALTGYLKRNSVTNVTTTLTSQINSTTESVRMATWWQQARIVEGMSEAAFAWYVTKDPWFLNEMRARMNLIGPAVIARKCTGDVSETRDYVWFFALAYDFAYAGMSATDRAMVKSVILTCANSGLLKVADTVKHYPENAIAFNALGKFMGALLIVRGDMPETHAWLKPMLPVYVDAVSPWGGDDGGFANGSTYAEWDAGESLVMWDLIERVLGVPFYKKPWLVEFARFISYALPPGTPAGVFGDGAEVTRKEDWARFGKAIMNRSATTLSRWYAQQQTGEDYARLHILLSPRQYMAPVALPSTQPQSAWFPKVGWAAMHSALADPNRMSIFFKSSPFGSINHSHADQNSFVLYSKGKVLAMDSGYYDYYNSPHWRDWYKQTRAHNAITFDGGQGQYLGATGLGDHKAGGRLLRFGTYGLWDITTGDATAAYGGKLTQATRTMVFIRPSTLVTIDQLNSLTPRKYEYNLHTSVPLSGTPASFRVTVLPADMCGVVASRDPMTMSAHPGYWPAPTMPTAPHYWNKFAYTTAKNKGLIVSVLRTDCLSTKPNISFSATGATIELGKRVITVSDADVTIK